MDDVRAVLDAAGSARAALVGVSEGAPLCILFAAAYPERTVALLRSAGRPAPLGPDFPWATAPRSSGLPGARRPRLADREAGGRGRRAAPAIRPPRVVATYLRTSVSPARRWPCADELRRSTSARSSRASGCRRSCCTARATGLPVEDSRYLAGTSRRPLRRAPGEDHLPSSATRTRSSTRSSSSSPAPPPPEPTGLARRGRRGGRGDVPRGRRLPAAARAGLSRPRGARARGIAPDRGREIRTTGAGFLATFHGPARGVRCAAGSSRRRAGLGPACGGVDTGECDVLRRRRRDGGVAVQLACGVPAQARPATFWSRGRSRAGGRLGPGLPGAGHAPLRGRAVSRRLFRCRLGPRPGAGLARCAWSCPPRVRRCPPRPRVVAPARGTPAHSARAGGGALADPRPTIRQIAGTW